jgi:dihydroflavonol-4-reductase
MSFPRCVAITGGAGFLGTHLVPLIRARCPDTRIQVTDALPSRPAGFDAAVTYARADVLDLPSLVAAFQGVEAVVHLAGLVSFWRVDRDRLFAINRDGTRNVLRACARAGVRRLVHVSSAAAIGFTNNPHQPVAESLAFDWSVVPHKHYMLSKRAGELELADADRYGVSAVIANPASMYGPGDTRNTHRLFRALQRGVVRAVPPGGNNVVDVRDVAEALYRLISSDTRNERFILGGHNLTFVEINLTIARVLGVAPPPWRIPGAWRRPLCGAVRLAERLPGRPAMIAADDLESAFYFRYYSSAKAAQALGWTARYTFEQTARDAATFLVSQGLLDP